MPGESVSEQTIAAGPITSTERILELDILRGMALFGILAANIRGFSAPLDVYFDIGKWFHSGPDLYTQLFIDIFVQRKFVSLFSFMFGMGFAVQLLRAEARGSKFLSFYPRRLASLALFGLIHGIGIWAGDILLTYAIAGTILLLFRNKKPKILLRVAGAIVVTPLLVSTGFVVARAVGLRKPPAKAEDFDLARITHIVQVYSNGSLLEIMKQNWLGWLHELDSQVFAIFALSLFLLGLWVVKKGILHHLEEYKPALKRTAAIGLPVGIVMNATGAVLAFQYSNPRPPFVIWVVNTMNIWAGPVLAAGYAAGLAVLLQNPKWRARLHPFAAVGRTALTNYLLQSIICVTFFRLTHLYGVWGPAWDLIPTVVLFTIQIVVSNWWLETHRYGPMEWIWRRMTYGKS